MPPLSLILECKECKKYYCKDCSDANTYENYCSEQCEIESNQESQPDAEPF